MPVASPAPSSRARYLAALAALVAAGAALRIAGAGGDLWYDEIWSLDIAATGPAAILFGAPQDNNHVLNSLWLWLVGPAAPERLMRAASIAWGVATIPAAAAVARAAAGPAAGLAAAALFAVAYPFVLYGSEARGYAGLILALVVATGALARVAADPHDGRARWIFAGALAFGAFSHLTMAPAAMVLSGAALVAVHARWRDARRTGRTAARLASAGFLGLAAPLGALAWGALATRSLRTGYLHPFDLEALGEGMGRMALATLGLPDSAPPLAGLALAVLIGAAAVALAPRGWRAFAGAALVGFPALAVLGRLPNPHIPRFHLAAAVVLTLVLAAAFGRLWTSGRQARAAALAVLTALLAGGLWQDTILLERHRGDYRGAVAAMAGAGVVRVGSNLPNEASRMTRYYAPRAGAFRIAPEAEWRADPPDCYLLIEDRTRPSAAGPAATVASRAYDRLASFETAPLSGYRWTVYRPAR